MKACFQCKKGDHGGCVGLWCICRKGFCAELFKPEKPARVKRQKSKHWRISRKEREAIKKAVPGTFRAG